MRRKSLACVLVLVFFVVLVQASNADTLSCDFSSGLGPNFSVVNTGGLWNVTTNGSGLEISKPSDTGTYLPSGLIRGGARSQFAVNGDFTITVGFTLPNLPGASGASGLNESVLNVTPTDGLGVVFEILRYSYTYNQQMIETYSDPPASGLVGAYSNITSGSYQLVRTGSTIAGLYAPEGSSSFTPIGSYTDFSFSEPMYVELLATQNTNVGGGPRSTTAMDITFNNLVVQADNITGVVPEPSTLALLGTATLGLLGYALRRRKPA